eukprot:GSA25T00003445001.1
MSSVGSSPSVSPRGGGTNGTSPNSDFFGDPPQSPGGQQHLTSMAGGSFSGMHAHLTVPFETPGVVTHPTQRGVSQRSRIRDVRQRSVKRLGLSPKATLGDWKEAVYSAAEHKRMLYHPVAEHNLRDRFVPNFNFQHPAVHGEYDIARDCHRVSALYKTCSHRQPQPQGHEFLLLPIQRYDGSPLAGPPRSRLVLSKLEEYPQLRGSAVHSLLPPPP